MSTLEVGKIVPATGTAITLGESGDTLTVPSGATLAVASGATLANSGTATGFGGNNPSFAAYNSSSQSLTTGAYNKITATTEVYDTGGCYDATNAKFVVPAGEGGKYLIWTRASVNTGGSSALIDALGQWIYLGGSASRKLYWQTPSNSTVSASQTFIGVMDLADDNELEWYIYVQFSSGTISAEVGPSYNEWGAFKLAGV